jgi:hypothetical protein
MDKNQTKKFVKSLDADGDDKIDKEEISAWFQANKKVIAIPFAEQLSNSHDRLDKVTLSPIAFSKGDFDYYYSSQDKRMNATDAVGWCNKAFGGNLIDSDHESVFSRMANATYWSKGNCKEFVPFGKAKTADCSKENAFVCIKSKNGQTTTRAPKPEPEEPINPTDQAPSEVVQLQGAKLLPKQNPHQPWIYLTVILAIILLGILACLIRFCCFKKKPNELQPVLVAPQKDKDTGVSEIGMVGSDKKKSYVEEGANLDIELNLK